MKKITTVNAAMAVAVALTATACNGILSDIYDEPRDSALGSGQLVVDATSWHDWYYIDFDSLAAIAATGGKLHWPTPRPLSLPTPSRRRSPRHPPTPQRECTPTGSTSSAEASTTTTSGPSRPPMRSPSPPTGASPSTATTSGRTEGPSLRPIIRPLPTCRRRVPRFASATFTPDEWSERDVWVDQSQMLRSLIGCQGIMANKVLSSWIKVAIPPMPPAFTGNSHVFIIRFPNGKMAAVQLANYISPKRRKVLADNKLQISLLTVKGETMILLRTLFPTAALMASLPTAAQMAPADTLADHTLDQVVVTGTRTPKSLLSTPVQTLVISGDDIRKADATDLRDLLSQVLPGVEFSYAMNQQTHMNFAGFGGQSVLVLVDGQRLAGETMDDVDFARLDMQDVDHIEIVKSAASALYGSNAAGGVINIITKMPLPRGTPTSTPA